MSLQGLEDDPHIIVLNFIRDNWPDDNSVIPKKSQITFGQWPNNQNPIFVVTQELLTSVLDTLDISQNVSDNHSVVDVHMFVTSFTILTGLMYPPESDPTYMQNMVTYLEQFFKDNVTGLQDKNIVEVESDPAIWLDRHSWQDDIFHTINRVRLQYYE